MKFLKKMTPMMLATMMLAPGILLDQANANERIGRGNGERRDRTGGRTGDRDRGDDTSGDVRTGSRGRIVTERDFRNWDRRYVGRRTFKLLDDEEFKRVSDENNGYARRLQNQTTLLDSEEKKLEDAVKAKNAIDKEISDISAAIVQALSEQSNLKKSLPNLRKAVRAATEQRDLAKVAADSTNENVIKIKEAIEKAKSELKTINDNCSAAPAADCNAKITNAKDKLEDAKAPLKRANRLDKVAQQQLAAKNQVVTTKRNELKAASDKVVAIDSENDKRAETLELKKAAKNTALALVKAQQAVLRPITRTYNEALKSHNESMTRKNNLKELLIRQVMNLNSVGANVGEEAGSIDGDYYAEYLGLPAGQNDGDRDGTESGRSAGQSASYNRGLGQGEIEGNSTANTQGNIDGNNLGVYQGHVAAATEDGNADGKDEANDSDAANVGTAQGRTAGLDRAKDEGQSSGEAIGEKQAIDKHENGALETSAVNGNFAGAFAPVIPDYPGFNCIQVGSRRYHRDDYNWRRDRSWRPDHQICPNFQPRRHADLARTRRPILRTAFMDAYLMSYRQNRRGQFVRTIDNYYINNYESSRAAAYSTFSNREYPVYTEQGRTDGYTAAYDARYPIIKEEARRVAFESAVSNPNTQSQEYTGTYASVKDAAYKKRYEEIRSVNFGREEQSTFNENIEEQTEIFRENRFAKVDAIYNNHPVLKFVTSAMKDGGIDSIAKADDIFQPGEKTLHSLTIMNFGAKAANNVTVKVNDGSLMKLPTIEGKRKTTIKGALAGQVPTRAKIGNSFETNLKVFSPLTAEKKIQGRHYYATSSERLNFGDVKKVSVAYPMALSSLKTASQLLINQGNTLSMSVSNNSSRKYTGDLKVELEVNSQTGIITKNFDDISEVKKGGSKTINSAKVLVASERDTFTPLTFTAVIKKQGVTLGVLNSALTTMAKAPYSAKSGKPVFLANSDKNPSDLIGALERVGGLANASVIDLSLSRMNRDVLAKGLNKKMIISLDDLRGSTMAGVATLLKNSEDTVMIFVDERNAGINLAANQSGLRNATVLPVNLKGNNERFNLRFTNPFLDGVKEMTVVAQTTPRGMVAAMDTLKGMMKTNNEFVSEAGSALSERSVLTKSSAMENMIAMATAEIVNISKAYDATNNDRYKEMVGDNNRIYARILDQSGKKVKRNTLSKNLAAWTMYQVLDHSLDKFDPVDDVMDQDIELKVEDRLRDTIKGTGLFRLGKGLRDNLKKEYKSLYNKTDENPYVQSPFKF